MIESTPDPTSPLEYHGFMVLKQFIPHFFATYLEKYIARIDKNICQDDPALDTFGDMSSSILSQASKKNLILKSTIGRVYKNNDHVLPFKTEHFQVVIYLGGECEKLWPVWMMNKDVHQQPQPVILYPGDAVMFNSQASFWRDHFEGTSYVELTLNYESSND